MSELKATTPKALVMTGRHNEPIYIKSEADKVIADLEESHKMEVEQLLMTILELKEKLAAPQLVMQLNTPKALFSNLDTMGRLSHEIDVVARRERHQKYKRCLSMAKWCGIGAQFQHDIAMRFDNPFYIKRAEWLEKWRNRWLAIAEKFKTN